MELHATGGRGRSRPPIRLATEAGAIAFERGGQRARRGARRRRHARGELPAQLRRGRRPVRAGAAAGRATSSRSTRAGGRRPASTPRRPRRGYGGAMPEQGPRLHHRSGRRQRMGGPARGGRDAPVEPRRSDRRSRSPTAASPSPARSRGGARRERRRSWRPTPAWSTCSSTTAHRCREATCSGSRRSARRCRARDEGPAALYGGASASDTPRDSPRSGVADHLDDLAAHRRTLGPPLSGALPRPRRARGARRTARGSRCSRCSRSPNGWASTPIRSARTPASLARRLRGRGARPRSPPRGPRRDARPSVHAAGRRAPRRPGGRIRDGLPSAALSGARHGSGDTIALVTADAEGWAVSLIQSLWDSFGSGHPGARDRDRRARSWRLLHARARPSERDRPRGSGRSTR